VEYLAIFYTHLRAVQYKRYLQNIGASAESMPVPRKYSSNCGIAVRFSTSEDTRDLISEDIEKIFLLQDGQDRLIYNNEPV